MAKKKKPKKTKKTNKKTQKKISNEISLLMNEYMSTGKMTTSRAKYHPKNKKNAMKIAAAIAYGKHNKRSK